MLSTALTGGSGAPTNHKKSAKLKHVASAPISTKKRTPILPNVPTIAEATGLKDYEVDSWYAVFAPAKTPDEVVSTMHKAIATIAVRPDVSAKLLEQGAVGVRSTPDELDKIVRREINVWRDVVKSAKIEGE